MMIRMLVATSLTVGSTLWAFSATAQPAFVYANNPSSSSYTPTAGYAKNPAGGAVRIDRKQAGRYEVIFSRLGPQANGGNVQVSAYGTGPEMCKVERWVKSGPDLQISVRCFSRNRPADTRFSLLFMPPENRTTQSRGSMTRFAWAGQPNRQQYTAPKGYAQNSGRPVNIKRTGPGRYVARFEGVPKDHAQGGNVQVTSYGPGIDWCKVISWTPDGRAMNVQVACFGANGRPKDAAFSLLFTGK